jgi:hypothetical protein
VLIAIYSRLHLSPPNYSGYAGFLQQLNFNLDIDTRGQVQPHQRVNSL